MVPLQLSQALAGCPGTHDTRRPRRSEKRSEYRHDGIVPGLKLLPDIPIAVLTSMRSDESARYVNGTACGHEVWRALHDEWFRRSRNDIHIETTRSGHGIQDD